jgi:integrase/recombinase XerD
MKNYPPSIIQFRQYVELKDYRPPTKKEYVRQVWKLAQHYDCDPASLTENQVRQYYLFLREEQRCSSSTMKMAKWALRSYYTTHLKVSGWTVFEDLRVAEPKTVPVVLSRAEVQKVLAAVQEDRFATCLRLMYYCGLRVSEATTLQVRDILSRQNPPCLHIRNAKGAKDRYVPLLAPMLEELRRWWRTHRNPTFIFPCSPPGLCSSRPGYGLGLQKATHPMDPDGVQLAFKLARDMAGLSSEATPHTLRHSYATHLLEEGVSLRQISCYLGHESLDTTAIYTHLTAVSEARTQKALAALYRPRKV